MSKDKPTFLQFPYIPKWATPPTKTVSREEYQRAQWIERLRLKGLDESEVEQIIKAIDDGVIFHEMQIDIIMQSRTWDRLKELTGAETLEELRQLRQNLTHPPDTL